MTSDSIISVATEALWYFTSTRMTKDEEQEFLDYYYSQHGISEQDWYEVAEKIR